MYRRSGQNPVKLDKRLVPEMCQIVDNKPAWMFRNISKLIWAIWSSISSMPSMCLSSFGHLGTDHILVHGDKLNVLRGEALVSD